MNNSVQFLLKLFKTMTFFVHLNKITHCSIRKYCKKRYVCDTIDTFYSFMPTRFEPGTIINADQALSSMLTGDTGCTYKPVSLSHLEDNRHRYIGSLTYNRLLKTVIFQRVKIIVSGWLVIFKCSVTRYNSVVFELNWEWMKVNGIWKERLCKWRAITWCTMLNTNYI